MSWILAFAGFALLIVLHEFGHFAAAKAVGMRVERFALFFPPLFLKKTFGETEYGIGVIPLGGYVRISGMNPSEELPPEVVDRAYYKQPVWKRIVVIGAGPAMNFLVAFLILTGLFLANGTQTPTDQVDKTQKGAPAASVLKPGDQVLAVDGKRGDQVAIQKQISSHHCAGKPPINGCAATTPAKVLIKRDGKELTVAVTPEYDAQLKRTRLGFMYAVDEQPAGPIRASALAVETMWTMTTRTITAIAGIFDPEKRKEISGVVGSYEVTRQTIELSAERALFVLALISLSLAVVNLFPFLPLDGGHIFWAIVEKIRGKAVPFAIMEKSGVVGFILVLFLFAIGLSNDIGRLTGGGFGVR